VDLTALGSNVAKLAFTVSSSDSSAFGVNTPTYFAVDNVVVAPEPTAGLLSGVGLALLAATRRRKRPAR